MNAFYRSAAAALMLAGAAAVTVPPAAQAQSFSDAQKQEIGQVVREYLLKNPELLQEVIAEFEKRQAVAEADKQKAAITTNAELLFNSKRHVTLGNPQGDVTLVEFFDYNCGYCKQALGDMMVLMKNDPKLKIVLKEFPVLGPGSMDAAQVAVAANMQDKTGKKYLDFHQRLLGTRGQIDKARALAAAREAGFDVSRIEKDIQGSEVAATLEENKNLAAELGINGTPSYVVGQSVVPGAVGANTLKQLVAAARK